MPNYSERDIAVLARKHGYYELQVSPRDVGRMVSYRHDQKCGGVRINIYTTTGTVATCLDHPRRGKSQLFRRNMTFADLKDIFSNPRVHKDVGYHRKADGTKLSSDRMVGLSTYGYNFDNQYILDKFVSDDYPIDETFDSIALGFDCFFILEIDGTFTYSGIPMGLHNKLKGRQSWLPRPEIVKLGKNSCESYFIQFADGSSQWNNVPDELDDLLGEDDKIVDVLAIGDDNDYYVKFKDGCEHWNLPLKLSNLLNGRNGTRRGKPEVAGVAEISLGLNGDYAVKFTDGSIKSWCGKPGYSKEFDKVERVRHVELGAGNDFVIIG